jgi:hypothetical protein
MVSPGWALYRRSTVRYGATMINSGYLRATISI